MMRLVLFSVVLLCGLVFVSVASVRDTVTLNLTTTGCAHNCVIYDNGKCPSSIKVNGIELSHQEDGFNILVIDNFSGRMTTDYFRWFSPLSTYKWKEFRNFFKKINSSSTVVVVLQNMCSYFDKKWYNILSNASDIEISGISKYKYNTAILVGCKISCPKVIQGSIPFNYYGHSDGFTKTITFALGKNENKDGDDSKERETNAKRKGNVGSVLGGVIAVIFIICITIILYISYKRRSEVVNWKDFRICMKNEETLDNKKDKFDNTCYTPGLNQPSSTGATPIEQPQYEAVFPHVEKASKASYPSEHIYEYINPEKLLNNRNNNSENTNLSRDVDNEYYQPGNTEQNNELYQPAGTQGITSICSVAADANPQVFDSRRMRNRPSNAAKENTVDYSFMPSNQHFKDPLLKNEESLYHPIHDFQKGMYQGLSLKGYGKPSKHSRKTSM